MHFDKITYIRSENDAFMCISGKNQSTFPCYFHFRLEVKSKYKEPMYLLKSLPTFS